MKQLQSNNAESINEYNSRLILQIPDSLIFEILNGKSRGGLTPGTGHQMQPRLKPFSDTVEKRTYRGMNDRIYTNPYGRTDTPCQEDLSVS